MPLCPLQGYRIRINRKLWFETQQSTSFRAIQCSEYGAVYGVRWAIHHLLSTSSSCWKSIMAKPVNESWQFDIHIYSAYCIVKVVSKSPILAETTLILLLVWTAKAKTRNILLSRSIDRLLSRFWQLSNCETSVLIISGKLGGVSQGYVLCFKSQLPFYPYTIAL